MKTFIILLLALLIFFGFLWVGFQAGEEVLPAAKDATPKPAAVNARQQNLFLIHVDSLQSPQPRLLSAWLLFLYYADTPSMTFKPLFEQDGSVRHPAPLNELFSLGPDGSINPEFLKALRENLSLGVDGYLIMDDSAMASIAERFPNGGPTPEQYEVVIPAESQLIEQMCAYLAGAPDRKQGVELPWSEIIPDHFRTDMNFTTFMNNWMRLTRASQPPHCEIIAGS